MMRASLAELETALRKRLETAPDAGDIAWACAWLEACGYPGLKLLAEALAEERRELDLVRDNMGFDLKGVSCAWLTRRLMGEVERHGRIFLRNVRHGLYLLPFTVRANIGIGCPVDPAFALGGGRTNNPYAEKLARAQVHGVEVDGESWRLLQG